MIPVPAMLDGSERPRPGPVQLRAGPLTVLFETHSGSLRDFRVGDMEILRGLYVAVRDRNWGTVVPVLHDLRIEAGDRSFRVAFIAECRQREIDFVWGGNIAGDPHGTVEFSMNGQAHSRFLRNRIGFCVLHPGGPCAGKPCTVERVDGTIVHGAFPDLISPHQPFTQIRAISHEIAPGWTAEVRMEGDIFEMEDQRNWTDASFKTYCTPLGLPYPVEIRAGTVVNQTVTLRLRGPLPTTVAATADSRPEVVIAVAAAPSRSLPRIGLGMAHHGRPLSDREVSRLKALTLDHLRVDLDLSSGTWMNALRRAAEQATAIGASLEAACLVSDAAEAELNAVADFAERTSPAGGQGTAYPVATWLILHQSSGAVPQEHMQLARRRLGSCWPDAKIGSGTNANFVELNRYPPLMRVIDLICYSVNPQVHAFDNRSLIETLETQADTVRSARQLSSGLPVAVTPITLRPRFNPAATGPEAEPAPGELPSQVDIRQMSLFGAVWTLGSMKGLFESGAHSATWYETTGWRGVMDTEAGSPWSEPIGSLAGMVFPLYHVFADVAEFHGGRVLEVHSSHPSVVNGLALTDGNRRRLLLGNFGAQPQVVAVSTTVPNVRIRQMDQTNAGKAMRLPEHFRARAGQQHEGSQGFVRVTLPAYAVACIDIPSQRLSRAVEATT
jgi:D-apionolactonase